MTTKAYDIGDLRTLSVIFTVVGGSETNPTSLVLTVKEPDGTIVAKLWPTPAEVTNDAPGKFHFDFPITKAGRHIVNWTGVGAVATASENEFYARRKEAVA